MIPFKRHDHKTLVRRRKNKKAYPSPFTTTHHTFVIGMRENLPKIIARKLTERVLTAYSTIPLSSQTNHDCSLSAGSLSPRLYSTSASFSINFIRARCVKILMFGWLLLYTTVAFHQAHAFPTCSTVRPTRISPEVPFSSSIIISSTRISLALKDETLQSKIESAPVTTKPIAGVVDVVTTKLSYSYTENNTNNSLETYPFKYIMLGLLWLTACLSAIDRVAMSVAIIPMAEEFGFTDTTKGSISSLLSFGYAVTILPAGLLAGQWSPRLTMASGIAIWSVATVATPWMVSADTIGPLLAARMLVGAGESLLLPTSTRLLNEWTASNEKSRGKSCTVLQCFWYRRHCALMHASLFLDQPSLLFSVVFKPERLLLFY